ncbi:UDP-N-acetylmuramoyl-tripeptide--D-alanyl-D-alanine ligase [Oxynema aestuarii]|jgi:UDP-N-acetylmuramoyl-tripeptide--D-alanyl-D-alanine ligase|nr:UDP-N-acetylmuramoyl-tripeptide--D-alanyl-D-alanine ligase [Oxynema aestuarii]
MGGQMGDFLSVSELVAATGGIANSLDSGLLGRSPHGIVTDTRGLHGGEVFLALRGEHFDGHDFVETALTKGAIAAIVENSWTGGDPQWPTIAVNDTLEAYQAIAREWRDRFSIPVVGVTGSVGKTTTKELIAAVLAACSGAQVLKTERNYNNEIGVPQTLLQLQATHQYAVIEMAMRASGEIALLTQIARPTIAVITNVGTAHIERLGSEAAIARAKCELLEHLRPDGIAILNHDNARLLDTAAQVWCGRTVTYGLDGGDVRGELLDPQTLLVNGRRIPLPLPGRHNALNTLAAFTVAQVLGANLEALEKGIAVELPEGRSRRYEIGDDIAILDESYNAGVESMGAALELLAQTPGRRKIAVLGTMKELGERSAQFHERVGQIARQVQLDALFIFAEATEAQAMAAGAIGLPLVEILDPDAADAHDHLARRVREFAQPGDRILFKASHAMRLDLAIAQLTATQTP